MKKNIGIQCMLIGLSILMVALCVLNINFPLLLFCLFIQIFLLGVNVYDIIKLNQVMKCLIRENKQSKKRNISWEDGDTEKLKMLRRRVEVSALQSQINPHFLYNTLDSIRSKALLDKQTEIAAMTEILSKFFRYCISNDESLVKIKEEINHIRDYYYIQKYRFEDRIDIEIVIEDDEIYELYIPKMTLQPLIENAMIHGLERLAHQGEIILKINQTEQKLVITVSDNGMGMNLEELERLNERMKKQFLNAGKKENGHNGIALTNVNSRIKITFGEEYGIHYRSIEAGGTDAIIKIPRIDEFKRVKYENLLEDRR